MCWIYGKNCVANQVDFSRWKNSSLCIVSLWAFNTFQRECTFFVIDRGALTAICVSFLCVSDVSWECRLWNWFGRLKSRISGEFVEGSGGSRASTSHSEQPNSICHSLYSSSSILLLGDDIYASVWTSGAWELAASCLLANANFNLIIPLALLCFLVHISRRSDPYENREALCRHARYCSYAPTRRTMCIISLSHGERTKKTSTQLWESARIN